MEFHDLAFVSNLGTANFRAFHAGIKSMSRQTTTFDGLILLDGTLKLFGRLPWELGPKTLEKEFAEIAAIHPIPPPMKD